MPCILQDDQHAALLYSINLYTVEPEGDDASNKAVSATRLQTFRTELHRWKENTRRLHPDYYDLIYHPEPISINKLKDELAQDQCIIRQNADEDVSAQRQQKCGAAQRSALVPPI